MILEFVFLVISLSLALISSFTFWPVTQWLDFYKPLLMFVSTYLGLVFVTFFGLYGLSLLLINKKKEYTKVSWLSRVIFNNALSYVDLHAHIRLKKVGLNKVPKNERFLLVCNHRSNFDSMILSVVLKKQKLAFITKPSLFKIPIGGRHMRKLLYLGIDRQDNLQSLAVMKKAEQYISDDLTSIGVFPEGTRQQDKVIGDFHEGVFNIAIQTKCPVVVCSLEGTDKIKSNFPIHRSHVTLNFVETLYYDDYCDMNAKQLSDHVRTSMIQSLC